MESVESKTRLKNRKKIIEKASMLFMENGIAQTTIKDILESASLDRQTFYNYYNDKKELADYIFELSLNKFYETGFNNTIFEEEKTGYDKIKKYFNILLERYCTCIEESIYMAQYDYFNQIGPSSELIFGIYDEKKVINPNQYYKQGIEDGSIREMKGDQDEVFFVMLQNIGAYVNRILLRQNRQKNIDSDAIRHQLRILIDMHLRSIANA